MDILPFAALTMQSQIGHGGFGNVYRAKLDVAVKVLHTDSSSSSDLLEEMKIIRECTSPYVVQVLAVAAGPQATELRLVMEYMERGSLAKMLNEIDAPPPWDLVVKVALHVAQGLKFLHNLTPPVLHLDLKPDNVLLDHDLNAKLTDFGLSRVYHSQSSTGSKAKHGGTAPYMPPEALVSGWKPSKASDIYSFGIFLWALTSGKTPYEGAPMAALSYRIREGDRPDMTVIDELKDGRPGLDKLIDLMILCWHPEILKRPPADYCAEQTQELFNEHYNHDSFISLLEKLDIQDHPDAKPRSTSDNKHRLSIDPQKPSQKPPGQPGPANTIDHAIGTQIGNNNEMTINMK